MDIRGFRLYPKIGGKRSERSELINALIDLPNKTIEGKIELGTICTAELEGKKIVIKRAMGATLKINYSQEMSGSYCITEGIAGFEYQGRVYEIHFR